MDRELELDRLQSAWQSDAAELIIVYGRRRVGKTALLREFCADRPHTFWVASLTSEAQLRREFSRAVAQSAGDTGGSPDLTYDDWDAAFRAMGDMARNERHVVVIDEYPYLAGTTPGISSVLQKAWDEHLQDSLTMLVLCGSSIGMMEREALAYRAPLYGRRTGQIRLGPLPLRATTGFLPRYGVAERIETYAVMGGIPAYLERVDDRDPLLANVERQILDPRGYLYSEPEFMLREELREPRNYFAVMGAIAGGRATLSEIVQAAGIERTAVSRYLSILRELHLVERRVPVTESRPEKSRMGVYRLRDPFMRFWFRFVAPRITSLETGLTAPTAKRVGAELSQFTGPAFEDMCRSWLVERAALGEMPFELERIGSWWDRDREVDIVGIGPDALVLGECKWRRRPVGVNVLEDLERAAEPLVAGLAPRRVTRFVFSRAGFTPALAARAEPDDTLHLVAADRLLDSPTGRS